MKKLTPKQEKFCQLYVELGNASDAYRGSYDVKETTTKESVNVSASRLMADPKLTLRIDEIRANLKKANKIDKQWIIDQHQEIIDWYKELKQLAKQEDISDKDKKRVYMLKDLIKGSDFRGSLDSITKMLGLNEPEKVKQDIKIEIIEKKRD